MGSTVLVGLGVSSQTTSTTATATFDNVTGRHWVRKAEESAGFLRAWLVQKALGRAVSAELSAGAGVSLPKGHGKWWTNR
jgi:hypothetical protein